MNGMVNKKIVEFCGAESTEKYSPVVTNAPTTITWRALSEVCVLNPYVFERLNVPNE